VTPARYRLEARLPGFASLLVELTLASGEDVQRMLTMRVGSLMETITVTCAPAAAAAPQLSSVLAFEERSATPRLFTVTRERLWWIGQAPAAQVQPIRVGGQIAAPRQIKRVQPACPSAPIGSGGVVILEATVGDDGLVKDVKVLRSAPGRPDIDQSAIQAIRQWEYTPTRLNNVAVPVIMTVTVVYAPQ
jgi:TonB family protein